MITQYACCDERRRSVLADPSVNINGIDYIDVLDDPESSIDRKRTIIRIHFLKSLRGTTWENSDVALKHLKILGGEKIRDIVVRSFQILPGDGHTARLVLSTEGDLSLYRLAIIQGSENHTLEPEGPLKGFDPILSRIDFRFRPECMTSVCGEAVVCPSMKVEEPDIDYLAKDYVSFRNLMLERLSLIHPQWMERNPADLGVALVELLAYVGDRLSYKQDAVATEAYIGTARRRISVRRHARLVDYFMHDGCNARVLVQVRVQNDIGTADNPALPEHTLFLSKIEGLPGRLPRGYQAIDKAQAVFEIMTPKIRLYKNQNEMELYTWGGRECCLPKGATSATLVGDKTSLEADSIIIFQEVLGPGTGRPEDSDPGRRHAVRLIKKPVLTSDPIGNMLKGNIIGSGREEPLAVTEIEWGQEDALPFPICISSITDEASGQREVDRVSIALGNIAVADHGRTAIPAQKLALMPEERRSEKLKCLLSRHGFTVESCESLGTVPQPSLRRHTMEPGSHCQKTAPLIVPPRFNPCLDQAPLTERASLDKGPASKLAKYLAQQAMPSMLLIQVFCDPESGSIQSCEEWNWRRDLISSKNSERHYTVEVDNEGRAFIRFGDGVHGMAPSIGSKFFVVYRIGNGAWGNISAESIGHILSDYEEVLEVSNPLPAGGGLDPESMVMVKMKSPMAFRTQKRAVTPEDYVEILLRRPDIQKAVATTRWTGSWNTIFLGIDRMGGLEVDDPFKRELAEYLEDFRMAGQDLEINGAEYVSLNLELLVCVKPEYSRDQVRNALMQVLSNRTLPDGRRGVFHPDNFTFGQPVYASTIYEAALGIEGIEYLDIVSLKRWDSNETIDLKKDGLMKLGDLEVARLDNDPSLPERGILKLDIKGGRQI